MLSRVADSLYWMGRYLERAEYTARVLSVSDVVQMESVSALANAIGRRATEMVTDDDLAGVDHRRRLVRLAYSVEDPHAILVLLRRARDNARQVRDQITNEMWEALNLAYLDFKDAAARRERVQYDLLVRLMGEMHRIAGATHNTMAHGEGWRFLQMGRLVERIEATLRALKIHLEDSSVDAAGWTALLRMCCAFEPFIRARTAEIAGERVLDFLLFDPDFPRSLRHAARQLSDDVLQLGKGNASSVRDDVQRLAGRLRARLDYSDIEEVLSGDPGEFLAHIQSDLHALTDGVWGAYIFYPLSAGSRG